MALKLDKSRFTESIRRNPEGSIFLGYLYTDCVVVDGIAPGVDFHVGMPDLEVRITRAGKPRVDFPSDLKQIGGEEKRIARYFTASAASREALTKSVFSIPAVSRAVEAALRDESKTA